MTVRRALVVFRLPRGSSPPTTEAVLAELQRDRERLGLPPARDLTSGVAGPYAIELDGQPLDEWVAWEA